MSCAVSSQATINELDSYKFETNYLEEKMTVSVFALSKLMNDYGFNIKTLASTAGLTEADVREVIIRRSSDDYIRAVLNKITLVLHCNIDDFSEEETQIVATPFEQLTRQIYGTAYSGVFGTIAQGDINLYCANISVVGRVSSNNIDA